MALTLTQAQTALDAWIAADLAVAKGQSYSMNGRSLTLANSKEIREQIQYWERRVSAFEQTIQNNQQAALVDFSDV
jgi:ABC-type transport system involved in cytochrome bd biosynthesis fused ATPase/permease subunit